MVSLQHNVAQHNDLLISSRTDLRIRSCLIFLKGKLVWEKLKPESAGNGGTALASAHPFPDMEAWEGLCI